MNEQTKSEEDQQIRTAMPPALKHGCYSLALLEPLADELALAVRDQVAADAPWLDPVDELTLDLFCLAMARIIRAERWLREQGDLSPEGDFRPVLARLATWFGEARRLADALGLSPAARMSLRVGDARSRAFDAAAAIQRLKREEQEE